MPLCLKEFLLTDAQGPGGRFQLNSVAPGSRDSGLAPAQRRTFNDEIGGGGGDPVRECSRIIGRAGREGCRRAAQ